VDLFYERLLPAELGDGSRRRKPAAICASTGKKVLGGVGTMGSYGLALWAMTQAPLAGRCAKPPFFFGALIAFILLKEKLIALRIVAACGIAAGAILLRLS
jgi:drug/metabolite transporter (DMT)-like permease